VENEELKNKVSLMEETINNLKDSLKLKDNQIDTLKGSISLKDDQIKTLENTLSIKEEKVKTLEKTIELKENQLETKSKATVDKTVLEEKEEKIKELAKETEILHEELSKMDIEIEKLELENEKLQKESAELSDSKIIEYTNRKINKSEILEKMRQMLENSLHSVTIAVPSILELQELYLYEVKSSVSLKISCEINPGIDDHIDLLEEYESFDNIAIRHFEGSDRYVLVRDGEELLMAVIGSKDKNHLAFYTRDPAHIKFFNSLVMESWLRSKKI
jgi:hypothetical protein